MGHQGLTGDDVNGGRDEFQNYARNSKIRNYGMALPRKDIYTYCTLRGRLKGTASAVFAIQHCF